MLPVKKDASHLYIGTFSFVINLFFSLVAHIAVVNCQVSAEGSAI